MNKWTLSKLCLAFAAAGILLIIICLVVMGVYSIVVSQRHDFVYKGSNIKDPFCTYLSPTSVTHLDSDSDRGMTLVFTEGKMYKVKEFIDPAKTEGIYVVDGKNGEWAAGPFKECPLLPK